MSSDLNASADRVNELILEKLRAYPPAVAQLAARAVQLSEDLPEATVIETLQTAIREILTQDGGQA